MTFSKKFNPFSKSLDFVQDQVELQQNTLDTEKFLTNDAINAFHEAINGSLSSFALIDGIVDDYQDFTGILDNSDLIYNEISHYFTPAYNQLLIHADGVDASTSFIDSSNFNRTVTANGNAQIDTAQSKFGGASALFDGSGDYLSVPESSDFDIGTNDFTIDFWIRFSSLAGIQGICGQYDGVAGWRLTQNGSNQLQFRLGDGLSDDTALWNGFSLSINTWYNIRITRTGNIWRAYKDGIQTGGDQIFSSNIPHIESDFHIGNEPQNTQGVIGNIDEFAFSNSLRNSSNFTPETSPYPDGNYVVPTLISESFVSNDVPTEATLIIRKEDVDTITLNTDLKAYVSRDGGSTFTEAVLGNIFEFETGQDIITSVIDLSTQPSGTSMVYKIETLNSKQIKIHSTALFWQ